MKQLSRKHVRRLFAVAGTAIVTQGCATWDLTAERDLRLQQQQAMERRAAATMKQTNAKQARELAALRADLRMLQDTQRKLVGYIDELRQGSHDRATQVQELQSLVAVMESRMQTTDKAWRDRMQKLKASLASDQKRKMDAMAQAVGDEISTAVEKVRAVQATQKSAQQKSYTVVAGDTLSAIAQAFGISVTSIKAANSLRSDTIRVGQVLKIPAQ